MQSIGAKTSKGHLVNYMLFGGCWNTTGWLQYWRGRQVTQGNLSDWLGITLLRPVVIAL